MSGFNLHHRSHSSSYHKGIGCLLPAISDVPLHTGKWSPNTIMDMGKTSNITEWNPIHPRHETFDFFLFSNGCSVINYNRTASSFLFKFLLDRGPFCGATGTLCFGLWMTLPKVRVDRSSPVLFFRLRAKKNCFIIF